ncbi:DUF2637 domain-containing protein [Streptosporangium sp. NPDC003464]
MSTFYDLRAQRTIAQAEAEQARAEAEATRVETMLRLEAARAEQAVRQAEQARRDRLAREHARTARREERRRQRAMARMARTAAVRRGTGALAAAVVGRAPALVGAVAMGAPIAIAWRGQLEFADQVMHLGFMAPALPIALEGGVWYLAFLIHRAITAGLPIGRYRVATWTMAGIAGAMNFWHGITASSKDDGLQVGVILALASLLGIALWELTASLTQQTTAKRTAAEIRRAAWRRLRYPRLSWAAASIRASRGASCSIEQAWTAAWIDRYGVGPDASRRDRKLAKSIVGYQRKADRSAAKDGRLIIIDGSIVRPCTPSPQASEEAEEAMARLQAFSENRADVARSIAFPSIGSPVIKPINSIEHTMIPAPAPTPTPVEVDRSTVPPSIEPPVSPIDREDSIDIDGSSAPRRSIDEHRAALWEAIEAGDIDPREVSAEEIRRTLNCAPKTARTLRDELRTTAAEPTSTTDSGDTHD